MNRNNLAGSEGIKIDSGINERRKKIAQSLVLLFGMLADERWKIETDDRAFYLLFAMNWKDVGGLSFEWQVQIV